MRSHLAFAIALIAVSVASCIACDATGNNPCSSGLVCADGACRLPRKGEDCVFAVGCNSVENMLLDCRASPDFIGTKCVQLQLPGGSCEGELDSCNFGLVCSRSGENHQFMCKTVDRLLGESCSDLEGNRCEQGLECIAGRCGFLNGAGSICNDSCPNGLVCKEDTGARRCSRMLKLGEFCLGWRSFETCGSGLRCGPDGYCESAESSLGQRCGGINGRPCASGMSCRMMNGDAREKDDEGVCMTPVPFGLPCDSSRFTFCETSDTMPHASARSSKTRTGHIGDACGAGSGVVCDPGDECEDSPRLTCKLTSGSVDGARKICVNDNLQLGDPCPVSVKGEQIFGYCAAGLKCDYNALKRKDPRKRSGCVKEVDVGQACAFDNFIRCRYGLHCVQGKCEYKPFEVAS